MPANQFWELESPESTRKLAEWADGEIETKKVFCPVDPGHRRGGKRLSDLSVVLPRGTVDDFVWTWYSELLMQDHVLQLFREKQFTGFDVKPVKARFKKANGERPPKLCELVRTGWGGLARPESGIHVKEYCEACKHVVYTGLKDATKLIDEAQWDGSDFFMLWPMPNFVFVTERVVDCIRENRLTGVVPKPVSAQQTKNDGFGPGRLSNRMPEDRARALGRMCGIREI